MSVLLRYLMPNHQFPVAGKTAAEVKRVNDDLKLKARPGKDTTPTEIDNVAENAAPEGAIRMKDGPSENKDNMQKGK